MNAPNPHQRLRYRWTRYHRWTRRTHAGFTLVELMVVIAIIGILVGIAIPTLGMARRKAFDAALRTEVQGIANAVETYNNKYGDYPPDFMDWPIVARHYRKAFPNIAASELALLQRACDMNDANDSDLTIAIAAHNPTKLDRAEAIYWNLGGFSSDPQFPFTGNGGPLQYIGASGNATQAQLPAFYQVNTARTNGLFEFEASNLTVSSPNATAVLSTTNKAISTDEPGSPGPVPDLFPAFRNSRGGTFVYFDSRTYTSFIVDGSGVPQFNGWADPASPATNLVRPYMSDQALPKTTTTAYGSLAASLTGWEFINPTTFQVISSGADGSFGQTATLEVDSSSTGAEPVYFQYPSGKAVVANSQATAPGGLIVARTRGFQESEAFGKVDNTQLDNISNFSTSRLEDDVPAL